MKSSSIPMDTPVCRICCENTGVKVFLFAEKSLEKCKEVLSIRIGRNLKYKNVVLPTVPTNRDGYHQSCYKNFTALTNKPTKRKRGTSESEDVVTGGSLSLQNHTTPSSNSNKRHRAASESGDVDTGGPSFLQQQSNISTLSSDKTSDTGCQQLVTHPDHPSLAERQTQEDSQLSAVVLDDQVSARADAGLRVSLCLFCDKRAKKYNRKWDPLHKTKKETIAVHIPDTDTVMLSKIDGLTQVAYHNVCKNAYFNKIRSMVTKEERKDIEWHAQRSYYHQAYTQLCEFIEDKVIKNNNCYFLSKLHNQLICLLQGLAKDNLDSYDHITSKQYLEAKITETFKNRVKIIIMSQKKVLIPSDVKVEDLSFNLLEEEDILQKAAIILRREILEIKKDKLPQEITTQDLVKGECTIPPRVQHFYQSVIGGTDTRRRESINCKRKVKSLSQDLIYAVTGGRIKTSKHIVLGIVMKSLTSSRKIVDILNRYGHCCSYSVIEGLETEATFTSTGRSRSCPDGIVISPNLHTGVAFDNFDRFVDTASGKDTLHDTVGIIYQDIDGAVEQVNVNAGVVGTQTEDGVIVQAGDEEDGVIVQAGDEEDGVIVQAGDEEDEEGGVTRQDRKKRRRRFDEIIPDLAPYPKKLKMVETILPIDHQLRHEVPNDLKSINFLDSVWMMSHAVGIDDTPMWVGFNSRLVKDTSGMQRISYLTPINLSPTNNSVVVETMEQSQRIAKELGQKYMQVTYDLAIAKPALQIQSIERPRFDNLFIHFGPFHISMSLFATIGGKIIKDCGLPELMVESKLLASGSVNGLLSGKSYNRCKRLHPMAALGLEVLEFEAFLEFEKIEISDGVISELLEFQKKTMAETTDATFISQHEELSELVQKFTGYKRRTLDGEFGKTAQFYAIYIQLVNYYEMLNRSIRMGNIQLFKYVLQKITNLFFMCNHPNYARWMVKYHDNLMKVAETHPGLEKEFEEGYFGIKRTSKPFSKQPIDLTLEQTINADAARRLTGIMHMTSSISARQRWAISQDIRSSIITFVFDELGLHKSQDVTKELEASEIMKNSIRLKRFTQTVRQYVNPFHKDISREFLFNISSGKAASQPVEDFLLKIEENGNKLREDFISECSLDPARFEKPIKRNKIFNFSSETTKKKLKIKEKVQEVRMQRDLFGRMLSLSVEHNVNIEKVLSFPITPVPTSLCHWNGAPCKTDKSSLTRALEESIESEAPSYIDVVVIDGFFLVRAMKEVPRTFGKIAKKLLQMVTRNKAQRIDILFDQHLSPSIKDHERVARYGDQNQSLEYIISNPDQERPADFSKELNNPKFKEALVKFFIKHWASDEMIPFIADKTIRISFEKCHIYSVENGKVKTSVDKELSLNNHEEADTKLVHHVCKIDSAANVVMRCSDTDVLIIMLGNMDHLACDEVHIWIEMGTGNKVRYIDVSKLYSTLGFTLSKALPGLHALTGCDYNPAFFGKGKKRPFKILQSSTEYQEAFIELAESAVNQDDEVFKSLELFVCEIYRARSKNVDQARFDAFNKTYQAKSVNEPFQKKLKNCDTSTLPPCRAELLQQIQRSSYISSIWRHAHLKIPTTLLPEDNGWTEIDGKLEFLWFNGDQLPESVADAIADNASDDGNNSIDDNGEEPEGAEEVEVEDESDQDSDCSEDEDETNSTEDDD